MSVTEIHAVAPTGAARSAVTQLVREGQRPLAAARSVLASLSDSDVETLALEHLYEAAVGEVRSIERRAREEVHAAARAEAQAAKAAQLAAVPVFSAEEAAKDRRRRETLIHLEAWAEIGPNLERALQRYQDAMKVQWTKELLHSTFGTAEGRVTWGAATIKHHRSHMEIVSRQIDGAERDLALHQAAIEEITRTGVACLNEAVAA